MSYDKASFQAGFALGRMLWRPPTFSLACLSFYSENDFSIYIPMKPDGLLEYSTDMVKWLPVFGRYSYAYVYSADGVLYLRGTGNSYVSANRRGWQLTATADVECSGNIEMLLDYQTVLNGEHPTMAPGCFADLFANWFWLHSAPELPATELSEGCYRSMFDHCYHLKALPELPATELPENCYRQMFNEAFDLWESPSGMGDPRAFRIPSDGTGTSADESCTLGMFAAQVPISPLIVQTPEINTTYYYNGRL